MRRSGRQRLRLTALNRMISYALSPRSVVVFAAFLCRASLEADASDKLEAILTEFVSKEKIVGAQLAIGDASGPRLSKYFGERSVSDPVPVDAETRFCIGSCSKPFASATLLILAQDERLNLDTPISAYLSDFRSLKIRQGVIATRAPTLRELLSHRGGIYSQKRGMNQRQAKWIRDYRLTLEESVRGIAKERLLAEPGTEYAYSGAGYCVLGRVAEVVTEKSYESLFQETLAQSLELTRSTYFPEASDSNIATGSINGRPNKSTPHLSRPLNLPLIGGSLYSTALDCGRFAQMILHRGQLGHREVLSQSAFNAFTHIHHKGRSYGLGWSLVIQNRKTIELFHTGALASSRATMRINLESNRYAIVLYTISDPNVSMNVGQILNQAVVKAVRSNAL